MRLLYALLFCALSGGCATAPPSGIALGEPTTYTFRMSNPDVSGPVSITVGQKAVKWCHLQKQLCEKEYSHSAITSMMFFTRDSYDLEPEIKTVTSYYHMDVGKTNVWNVKQGGRVVGQCSVNLVKNEVERHYSETCVLGAGRITSTTVMREELLYMEGKIQVGGKIVRQFDLSSNQYTL